eukprot:m.5485 g.5485  ORF g.5485 m.5485 type:complete len:151 (-) comp5479_c0_seq1:156-608(-)
MDNPSLFEDIFDVKSKDKDGKRFDRVSRLHCQSESFEMELVIDIHTELYPVEVHDRFTFMLATTLNEDGSPDNGVYDQSGKPTLADKYEYVMHGRVYRCDEEKDKKLSVYVSYGGLLMRLKGAASNLQSIQLDSNIYLLVRKVAKTNKDS